MLRELHYFLEDWHGRKRIRRDYTKRELSRMADYTREAAVLAKEKHRRDLIDIQLRLRDLRRSYYRGRPLISRRDKQ